MSGLLVHAWQGVVWVLLRSRCPGGLRGARAELVAVREGTSGDRTSSARFRRFASFQAGFRDVKTQGTLFPAAAAATTAAGPGTSLPPAAALGGGGGGGAYHPTP